MLIKILLLLLFCSPLFAITLATQEWSPYQIENGGKHSGISFQYLNCISKESGLSFSVIFMPWSRAQRGVENGEYDGFFAASKSPVRDHYAVMSVPFIPQEWRFYFLPSKKISSSTELKTIRSNYRIGARNMSNIAFWLKHETFIVETPSEHLSVLVKMLEKDNIDMIAESKLVFEQHYAKPISSIHLSNHPLGIYIGKKYIAKFPKTMDLINQAALRCIDKIREKTHDN